MDINHKLREMNEQIETIRNQAPMRDEGSNIDPPFNVRIMREPLPNSFKKPHLESYHGITDPMDHLKGFKILMLLHGATDIALYQPFPSTLKSIARH